MTQLNKRIQALLLMVMISAAPVVYGMEVAPIGLEEEYALVETDAIVEEYAIQEEVEEARTAWYKERSAQIVAAVVVGATLVYATGVYMNKVSSPAGLWKKLFSAKNDTTATANDATNMSSENKNAVDGDGKTNQLVKQGSEYMKQLCHNAKKYIYSINWPSGESILE